LTPGWIQSAEGLTRLVGVLTGAAEVAVDTEGDSLHHYPARLALVQLAGPQGDTWLVDPLAVEDLRPLGRIFGDPATTTVLHAGDNDLVDLKRRHGLPFARIFDTSVAARFLGAPALGLDVLLTSYLGVDLPPSRQKDAWSERPLSDAQRRSRRSSSKSSSGSAGSRGSKRNARRSRRSRSSSAPTIPPPTRA
jgi:ribonuclease D